MLASIALGISSSPESLLRTSRRPKRWRQVNPWFVTSPSIGSAHCGPDSFESIVSVPEYVPACNSSTTNCGLMAALSNSPTTPLLGETVNHATSADACHRMDPPPSFLNSNGWSGQLTYSEEVHEKATSPLASSMSVLRSSGGGGGGKMHSFPIRGIPRGQG